MKNNRTKTDLVVHRVLISSIGQSLYPVYVDRRCCCLSGERLRSLPFGLRKVQKVHLGGPRDRVVKVADFSALNHSIISPLWVRASLGARVTCGTSQVLPAGVSGGFSPGTPVFAPPTD